MNKAAAFETVIGLEIHAQLLTRTKLFCSDSTSFVAPSNTQVSIISLAHPGTLPKMNREVIPLAIKLGLSLGCDIVKENYFARKNYFYPDLPKGYQVSQHTAPICRNGQLEVDGGQGKKIIRINRIHIEEDAGKTIHTEGAWSSIDYNRAGIPLLEIVTEPDISSAEEAYAFVAAMRKLVRKLGVCDGNMEEGSFRCDVNISLKPHGSPVLGTKAEIKNLNSLRFIKKAIQFEEQRMGKLLSEGGSVIQETRGFREADGTTYSIRRKEDEDDYRYFPEPDLPPFIISDEMIDRVRETLPEPSAEIKEKLIETYALTESVAARLADEDELLEYFYRLAAATPHYKAAGNWVLGPLKEYIQDDVALSPGSLAQMLQYLETGLINHGTAVQKILPALIREPGLDVSSFIKNENLYIRQDDGELEAWVDASLEKFSQKITEYRKGKKGLISLFVGEVMKLSKGKADARKVTDMLLEKLK